MQWIAAFARHRVASAGLSCAQRVERGYRRLDSPTEMS